jgi:hypothetical protein
MTQGADHQSINSFLQHSWRPAYIKPEADQLYSKTPIIISVADRLTQINKFFENAPADGCYWWTTPVMYIALTVIHVAIFRPSAHGPFPVGIVF